MKLVKRLDELLGLKGNLKALAVSEVVSDTGWNMYEVIWQPYVLSLGASMPVLGSLRGAQTALASALQLITGRVSDCVGRKQLLVASYVITIIGLSFTLFARSWIFLLPAVVLLSISHSLWEPVYAPLIAESVEPEERGTAFSLITLAWFLPGFYAPALAGFIADRYGFRRVLGIQLLTELSASIIFIVYVRETLKTRKRVEPRQLVKSLAEVYKPRLGLSKFYATMILNKFANAIGEGIFFGMLMKTFEFNMVQLGVLSNAFSVVVASSQLPFGRLVDRYGRRRFLVASKVMRVIVFIGYLVSRDFLGFLLCQVSLALAVSMWIPAFNAYVSNAVPEGERGRVFGDLNGLMGLLSFPAPILGALLYDAYGFKAPILVSLALTIPVVLALTSIEER